MSVSHKGTILGGALLVAGTSIGGGMLALPVLTAMGGFVPAVFLYTLCWLFMAATGLLFMEVFLWSSKEVNIVSMATMTLGRWGKVAAWVLYLFMFYSLTVAYVSGGGGVVSDLFEVLGWSGWTPWLSPLLFVCIFGPFVLVGAWAVDRINFMLMGGLILSFVAFFALGAPHVQRENLRHSNWLLALFATPVMFTSFGFQGIVPTLTNYLKRDPRRVSRAILFGSVIPLFTYILWEWLVVGAVPLSALVNARESGHTAVAPFKSSVGIPLLFTVGEFFAFFAIVTSFLGVTLGLLDFLADGLKVKKTLGGRSLLAFLIFAPPALFSMVNPCVFLNALQYAGGLGSALLLGLLPILMVWRGRYTLKFHSAWKLPGGRFVLGLMVLFVLAEFTLMLSGLAHFSLQE